MKREKLVRAISRGLEILQFINSRRSVTLTQISSELSIPYPTIYRIVETLVYEGYVEREPDRKRYRPTILVRSLSNGHSFENELAEIAKGFMTNFTEQHYWPLSLFSRVGRQMVVLESTHSQTTSTFVNYFPGDSVPFYESASAKVWLAHDPVLRAEIRSAPVYPGDDGNKSRAIDAAFTDDVIGAVKEQGYAVHGRCETDCWKFRTTSISVPVFRCQNFVAALTLTYFSKSLTVDLALSRLLKPITQCAQDISDALIDDVFPQDSAIST